MSIQKKRPVYDADELDVYQVKWVLGKQKGDSTPLKYEELKKLVESGRLGIEALSNEEKVMLNEVGINTDFKSKKKIELSNEEIHKRFRIAKEVTLQLYDGIEKEFENIITEEDWNKLSDEDKKRTRFDFFRLLHGTSPQFFAYDLFRGLIGETYGR